MWGLGHGPPSLLFLSIMQASPTIETLNPTGSKSVTTGVGRLEHRVGAFGFRGLGLRVGLSSLGFKAIGLRFLRLLVGWSVRWFLGLQHALMKQCRGLDNWSRLVW